MSDSGRSPSRDEKDDGDGAAAAAAEPDEKAPRKPDADLEDRHEDRKKSSRDRDSKKKDRRRSPSRDSRSRSRDRDKGERRERRRSRSRDRGRRGSGRDRDRSRSRSRDRDRHRRSSRRDRSNSRSRSDWRRRSRSHSRSPSQDGGRSRKKAEQQQLQPQQFMQLPQQMAPAAVAIGPGTGHDPFAALRQQQMTPVDPLEIQRMWQEQQLKARQLVLQQQAASAAQAASKTQREIYVGNLMPGAISEAMLQQIFNTALIVRFPGSNAPGMEPIIKANVHSSGKYAFLEFRTPEMASAALDLNGQVQFMGQAMSVNRPSGYVDPQKAAVAAAAASQALTAFQRGDPTALQAAGQSGAHLGALQLGMAMRPPMLSAGAGATAFSGPLAAAGALASASVAQSVAAAMLPGPPAVAAAAAAAAAPPASTCVCVTGMVTAATLQDDGEYKEIMDDLREECSRHGTVLSIKVPRPPQPELSSQVFGTGNFGKSFVQFADVSSAEAAKAAIHGRMFAGTTVQALSFPPEAFALL